MVKGRTIEEALKLTNQDVIDELGELPPAKKHCSVLAEQAIRAAIEDYKSKKHS
jgi:nitrogen fixation NifU-like protein